MHSGQQLGFPGTLERDDFQGVDHSFGFVRSSGMSKEPAMKYEGGEPPDPYILK